MLDTAMIVISVREVCRREWASYTRLTTKALYILYLLHLESLGPSALYPQRRRSPSIGPAEGSLLETGVSRWQVRQKAQLCIRQVGFRNEMDMGSFS